MTKKHAASGGLLLTVTLCFMLYSAGCRTPGPVTHTEPTVDSAAQFAAMSNQVAALSSEVVQLNNRLDAAEKEGREIKPSIEFIQKLLEEMRYEPVVQERLLGAPDTDEK